MQSPNSGVRSRDLHFGLGTHVADRTTPVEIRYRDRNGTPNELVLDLAPGWHTIVLPRADSRLASIGGRSNP